MIKLTIHPLFYFLMFLAGFTGNARSLILAFISVLIHEVARMLTAFGFGYRSAVIELFPFGGVAKLDYALYNDPVAEGVTALAGPVQSLILALLSVCFDMFMGSHSWAREMYKINLGLAFFNLLPLFPLDGGRILRALAISKWGISPKQVGKFVVLLTKVLTMAAMPFTVYFFTFRQGAVYPVLVLFFLFIAAKEENMYYAFWRQQGLKEKSFAKSGVIKAKIWLVEGERRMNEIIPLLMGKEYHLFFVQNKAGKIVGLLKEADLLSAFSEKPYTTFLAEVRRRSGIFDH